MIRSPDWYLGIPLCCSQHAQLVKIIQIKPMTLERILAISLVTPLKFQLQHLQVGFVISPASKKDPEHQMTGRQQPLKEVPHPSQRTQAHVLIFLDYCLFPTSASDDRSITMPFKMEFDLHKSVWYRISKCKRIGWKRYLAFFAFCSKNDFCIHPSLSVSMSF